MKTDASSPNTAQQAEPPAAAWQPFTPAGLSDFADTSFFRLLGIQSIAAGLIAVVFVWFLHTRWVPIIEEAIAALPETGEISNSQLQFPAATPQRLAHNGFLGIAVDLEHTGDARAAADIFLEFGRTECRVFSLFGYTPLYYQPGTDFYFNRPHVQPWWGAWEPAILVFCLAAVFATFLGWWWCMGLLYFGPVWLFAFFADRQLRLAGAWRISGAAMIPAGLFLGLSVFAYGWALLDFHRLLLAVAVHMVLGWCYLVLGVLARPRVAPKLRGRNPFAK